MLEQPDLPSAEIAGYCRAIHDSGRQLLGMIDQALDIVAMDRGLREVDRVAFVVAAPAAVAVARTAALARGHEVRIVQAGEPSCVGVGDAILVQKAIEQLLDNAVRAAPAGSEVALSWRRDGGQVEIGLRDHGAGIADLVIARIGTLFLQADQTRSRAWEGAGLGLAFAHRVAMLHGGTLTLSRPDGGGTRAVLAMPAVG
jgi:signal transduction histidine kinase